jgi:hypothetical protein
MNQSTNLLDYIKVYKIVTPELCQSVIESAKWRTKPWVVTYGNQTNIYTGVDCSELDPLLESKIMLGVSKGLSLYSHEVGPKQNGHPSKLTSGSFRCMINRYNTGIELENHFDQNAVYNPSITCIIMLNHEFEGGELVFMDEYPISFNIGEAVYFPSNFMFTHKVTKVTQGTRYTLSIWLK